MNQSIAHSRDSLPTDFRTRLAESRRKTTYGLADDRKLTDDGPMLLFVVVKLPFGNFVEEALDAATRENGVEQRRRIAA